MSTRIYIQPGYMHILRPSDRSRRADCRLDACNCGLYMRRKHLESGREPDKNRQWHIHPTVFVPPIGSDVGNIGGSPPSTPYLSSHLFHPLCSSAASPSSVGSVSFSCFTLRLSLYDLDNRMGHTHESF